MAPRVPLSPAFKPHLCLGDASALQHTAEDRRRLVQAAQGSCWPADGSSATSTSADVPDEVATAAALLGDRCAALVQCFLELKQDRY